MSDFNDELMGGGIPAISFRDAQIGTEYTLTIDRPIEKRQQTDYDTGEPLFWPDGNPKEQFVVTGDTPFRAGEGTSDPEKNASDDDGKRRFIFRRGWKEHRAITSAVKKAGAKGLHPGGKLTLRLSGTEKPSNPRFNPIKLYEADYVAPDPANESFMAEDTGGSEQSAEQGSNNGQGANTQDVAALLANMSADEKAKLGL